MYFVNFFFNELVADCIDFSVAYAFISDLHEDAFLCVALLSATCILADKLELVRWAFSAAAQ